MDANEYGLDAEFLYRYLAGNTVRTGKTVGITHKSGMSDDKLMLLGERLVTVRNSKGQLVGWSNGHMVMFEETPTKRPRNWEWKRSSDDSELVLDDFAPVLAGDGKMAWAVEIVPWVEGHKAVKFVTLEGDECWVGGPCLSAFLKRLGKNNRRDNVAAYRIIETGIGTVLAVYNGTADVAIGCVSLLIAGERGLGADAEITVTCSPAYMPPVANAAAAEVVDAELVAEAAPTPEPEPVTVAEPEPEPLHEVTIEPEPTPEPLPEPVEVKCPVKSRRGCPVLLDVPEPDELPSPAFYVVNNGGYHVEGRYL